MMGKNLVADALITPSIANLLNQIRSSQKYVNYSRVAIVQIILP